MAGTGSNGRSKMISGINVTPLVDISLVLLIIVMVTASYITALSLRVELPQGRTGEETQALMLTLTIRADGSALLNGRATTDDALRREVIAKKHEQPNLQVVISADRDVNHGRVVHFIDLMKRLGVSRFAISIEHEAA